MSLRRIGTVSLPPHAAGGGFDHAGADRSADRLYVAHTSNDAVEVLDLERRSHEGTLQGFPGVAGAAAWEGHGLLVTTCRGDAAVGLAALAGPGTVRSLRRVQVGARPNGLALAPGAGVALAACLGEAGAPSLAVIDLERGAVLASAPLPGPPRWVVCDPDAGCFYVNIAAPPQIAVVRGAPPFEILRSIPVPVPGPHGLDLDEGRGLLHCACDGGAVVTVEAGSGRVVAQVLIAGVPDVVFFNPRRDRLYIAVGDPGVLQSIDTAAGRVVETLPTEKGAKTFGFDAGREHLFVLLPATNAAAVLAEA